MSDRTKFFRRKPADPLSVLDDNDQQGLECMQAVVTACNKIATVYPPAMVAAIMLSQGICAMLDAGADPHVILRLLVETVDLYNEDKDQN